MLYRCEGITYTKEEVVDLFLEQHSYWFDGKPIAGIANSLTGLREASRNLLLTDFIPDDIDDNLIYVHEKFTKEFLPCFEVVP